MAPRPRQFPAILDNTVRTRGLEHTIYWEHKIRVTDTGVGHTESSALRREERLRRLETQQLTRERERDRQTDRDRERERLESRQQL